MKRRYKVRRKGILAFSSELTSWLTWLEREQLLPGGAFSENDGAFSLSLPPGAAGPDGEDLTGEPGDDGDPGPDALGTWQGPPGETGDPGPNGNKLAIVPVVLDGRTDYRALYVIEAPRFEFVDFIDLAFPLGSTDVIAPIDARFLAAIDPASAIEIRSVHPSCAVQVIGQMLHLTMPAHSETVRIQLAGIARGHGTRFPEFTDAQREHNAARWASALGS